nr:MAG TPA: hypothetical protein [Caudoviricetes sp.]
MYLKLLHKGKHNYPQMQVTKFSKNLILAICQIAEERLQHQ